jgi:hypothetical protein
VRGIGDMVQTLTQLLPPWALALVVVAVGMVAVPAWLGSLRSKRLKAVVRQMVRAEGPARVKLIDEAFVIASRPQDLVTLAEAARKMAQHDVHKRALSTLEANGALPAEVRRLRKETARQKGTPVHPVETAVIVERLIKEGAVAAATARLDEALRRFPDDQDLLALSAQLSADAQDPPTH